MDSGKIFMRQRAIFYATGYRVWRDLPHTPVTSLVRYPRVKPLPYPSRIFNTTPLNTTENSSYLTSLLTKVSYSFGTATVLICFSLLFFLFPHFPHSVFPVNRNSNTSQGASYLILLVNDGGIRHFWLCKTLSI